MRRRLFVLLLGCAMGVVARPASAQSSLSATCDSPEVQAGDATGKCLVAAQALVSAQPSVGILVAGGNPTVGTSGSAGFRLGVLPRLSAGIRLNVVPMRLPDIIGDHQTGEGETGGGRYEASLAALSADASFALTRGFTMSPGMGGIGALSLLGSFTYVPVSLFDAEGFERSSNQAFGVGARLHLLDESFVAPGVSVSVMRRTLDEVRLGDICDGNMTDLQGGGDGSSGLTTGACASGGDPGEIAFDLTDWSTRLVASKHLLGIGVSGGIGYDRYASEGSFGFRDDPIPGTDVAATAFRVADREFSSSRWSVFGDLSYTLLVGTIGAEGGWQQGGSAISGFGGLDSDFDPGAGTWFGSIGARLAL